VKKFILVFVGILSLNSCGTVKGTLDATGSILEGVATDARTLGSIFK
jgi:hypothetical protein